MPVPSVTVVIPTLAADSALLECLRSLERQTYRDFEVVIVDNSGRGLVRERKVESGTVKVIENRQNVGFGAAINQGAQSSQSAFIATINDDAVADEQWLAQLVHAAEIRPAVGMCASQVRLQGRDAIDSAGMLIGGDGSSKQRGHLESPARFGQQADVLMPSGSAALYRRGLFDQTGGFDEDFFLYCEDTDLGLRARWAGWECLYVPEALVEHRYSHSAGRASALKAYYVERNRLAVAMKNFPMGMLVQAPFVALARYWWHLVSVVEGKGAAGEFHSSSSGLLLVWIVLRAHVAVLLRVPSLVRKRALVRRTAKLTSREFGELLRRHSISARQVAAL